MFDTVEFVFPNMSMAATFGCDSLQPDCRRLLILDKNRGTVDPDDDSCCGVHLAVFLH